MIRKITITASVRQDWANKKADGEWSFIHSPSIFIFNLLIRYFFLFRFCETRVLPRLLVCFFTYLDLFKIPINATNSSLAISAAIYSDGRCKEVGIQWQDVGELEEWDNVSIHSSFCLFEGSRSLQAERKIWSFGYDCGLTEEVLPALSVQGADRELYRSVISNMDFAELRGRAVLDEDLLFPNLSIHGLADGW